MSFFGIGVQLTVFGMGLVFLLLALMALGIRLLLRADSVQPESEASEEPPVLEARGGFSEDELSAIMVALTTHITVRRKEAAPLMRQHKPGTIHSRWVSVGKTLQNTTWQPERRNQ